MNANSTLDLQTGEISSDLAFEWFQGADFRSTPPYFLTHWKTKKFFFFYEGSLLAFEKTRKQFIITGEPAMSKGCDDKLLYKAFIDFAHKRKKKICGFYVGENWENDSFKKRPLGTSFRVRLDDYDIKSSKAKEVRRSLRKGASSQYNIIESHKIDLNKLKKLLENWKKKKLPLKLKFFLSEPQADSLTASFEKWYVIEKEDQYYAFCSTLPYKNGTREGLYIDHLVYDPFNEKSALSYLISSLIHSSIEDDVDEINLGLNPFANMNSKDLTARLFKSLYNMPFLYRPKGLHYFKSKFAGAEETEFFFHEKHHSPIVSLIGMLKSNIKR